MALFDVPGWGVPGAPVAEAQNSRKRKRPSAPNGDKVATATVNLEKLMRKLDPVGDTSRPVSTKNQRSKKAKARRTSPERPRKKEPPQKRTREETSSSPHDPPSRKKTKKNANAKGESQGPAASMSAKPSKGAPPKSKEGLTVLQAGMKNSLEGARFRWINELLYKSDSEHAHQMIRENPEVYQEYHTGFRHQVHSWPTNPVEHYISSLSSYPPRTVIADLGCGDAALARALLPKEMTVLSFDLVSDGAFVVEADICSHIPLPGSEDNTDADNVANEAHAGVADVVVCALSLMGTNWPKCIREAWRISKPDGELKIAEVASRFTDVDDFVNLVSSVGFRLKSKDDRNTHFTLFEFKKVARKAKSEKEWAQVMSRGDVLKPCEYKRR
ncbi:hypothetical protein IEO21_04553 [Rhodonia placenta]|uniref:Ribosomal RNA-processing protein 8 n=1 Tax=Rhodonia placenta TaxID=104341 RepID=A0A8H7P3Z8_9APHY|nr:hypothetical protein IEO21_04553 [Postia placenta]